MKKIIYIVISIIVVILIGSVSFFIWAMSPKSKDSQIVEFIIEPGTSKTTIAKNLASSGLIKNAYALDIYLFFNRSNIQAGTYELQASMKPETMISKFSNGDVKIETTKITLVEGKRLTDYAETLSKELNFTVEEFIDTAKDPEYLQSLIQKYWFITEDILNPEIYYPLEGYLYPDTYEFTYEATPKTVIEALINQTESKIEPYKSAIEANQMSFHELLTLSSIVEKEANTENDRKTASQVFYTRLASNWSLGSDVTAFYGAKKQMGKDSETWEVLNGKNPYNTRLTDGTMNGKLPIGPICNPSESSINAVLNPNNTNYYYFVANVCTGEVFFQTTAAEFDAKVKELATNNCI